MKFFLRIPSLLKSSKTNIIHKSDIFSTNKVQMFENSKALSRVYWLVMKLVLILVFFGGLRYCESMNLV